MEYKKSIKKNHIFFIIIAVLFLCTTTAVWGQISKDNQGYRTINIVEVSGRVSAVKDGIEYQAYPGMLLQEGQEIVTSSNSSVRLILDDDKYVKLESGTRVIFETLGVLGSGKTKIKIERGALTSEIIKPLKEDESFVVNTPNVALAVRGTFFRVDLSINETGELQSQVLTFGGQVASQRVLPSGEMVEEEVLIDAGYKTTVNMTEEDTYYVLEEEPDEMVEESPTYPIVTEDVSDEDLVDIYFAAENGHELFITVEEAKKQLEEREIVLEEYTSVYEKAEQVKIEQEVESSGISNTTSAAILANDNEPLAKVEEESVENVVASSGLIDGVHIHNEKKTTIEPTCTTAGSTVITCRDCKETISVTEIPALGHTEMMVGIEEVHSKCALCEAILSTEHVYVSEKTKVETCEESGEITSTCSCGLAHKTEVAAQGHDYETEFTIDKAVTCLTVGSKSKHCSRCESRTDVTEIFPIGHSYGDWEIVKAETCEETGLKESKCVICQDTYKEVLPELGHNRVVEITEATDLSDGRKLDHCTRCDVVYEESVLWSIALHFPDSVFAQYVAEHYDTDGGNSLSPTELAVLQAETELDLSGTEDQDGGIASLEGIEYFTALESLDCEYNYRIQSIDVSNNKNLSSLAIQNGIGATSLDVSGCSKLTEIQLPVTGAIQTLDASNSGLTRLNTTAQTILTDLNVENTPLTYLQINSEALTTLDLSTNDELVDLNLNGCRNLITLDLSGHTALMDLNMLGCARLSTLNLDECTKLRYFQASETLLEELDLSGKTRLSTLSLTDNIYLTDLSLSGCTSMSNLDIATNTALETLDISNAGISTLDLSAFTVLETLDARESTLTDINLMQNGKLQNLYVSGAGVSSIDINSQYIQELDLSQVDNLTRLNINNCYDLDTLTLQSNSSLQSFTCSGAALEEIDLSSQHSLTWVSVLGNSTVETLNVSRCENLTDFWYGSNTNLKHLNISECTGITSLQTGGSNSLDTLVTLNAHASGLTSLSLSGMSVLEEVTVTDCQNLSSISSGDASALKTIDVSGSALTELDLSANNNLESLGMNNTKLEILRVSSDKLTGNALNLAGAGNYLKELYLTDCVNMTGMVISSNEELTILHCTNSGLSTIDVVQNRKLVEVDVSNSSNLYYLMCINNSYNLEKVNVSGTRLYELALTMCSSVKEVTLNASIDTVDFTGCTSLESIDLSECTQLRNLSLTDTTNLTALDVTNNTALVSISLCGSTGITYLDVTNNTNLEVIYTDGRYAAGDITFDGISNSSIINDEPYS